MSDNPIERLYAALSRGDLAAVRACFTPEARVWHGFDGLALDIDSVVEGFEGLIANTQERYIEDIRLQAIEGGFVQQHLFVVRLPTGARKAWPVCVVVKTAGGLIARIEEYIDRAGSFAPAEGPLVTPGL